MTTFDEQLAARLAAFQKAKGLSPTGVAGAETWARLTTAPVTPTTPPPASGLPPEVLRWTKIPGEGFGAGGGSGFGTGSATGRVVAGGAEIGEGTFFAAETEAVVTGASEVAAGEVAVGGTVVAEGGAAVVAGGKLAWAAAAGEALALAVVGAIVVTGTAYLVVRARNARPAPVKPGQEYPGTSLPGGLGDQPAQAPGVPAAPAREPGNPSAAQAPGTSSGPVEAPGIVDDPVECHRLNGKGIRHDHHIFPRQFRTDFMRIGIDIDQYTVTLGATEHIGARGIHTTMDWNGEWDEFFDTLPATTLTEGQASQWYAKAMKKAFEMMTEAGIDRKRVHPYRG